MDHARHDRDFAHLTQCPQSGSWVGWFDTSQPCLPGGRVGFKADKTVSSLGARGLVLLTVDCQLVLDVLGECVQ